MQSVATEKLTLYSPLAGPLCALEEVPDPVFAGRLLGDGIAIDPINERLTSPCKGQITHLARTGHALTITTPEGAEILLHLGIETVQLGGQGFHPQVAEGDWVKPGDLLIEFDADYLACHAKSLLSVMLVTNADRFEIVARSAFLLATPDTPLLTLRERPTTPNSVIDSKTANSTAELCRTVVVAFAGGLHARPAARIRDTARRFLSRSEIAYDGKRANCTSITALLGLGIGEGQQVTVYVSGDDASTALDALAQTLQTYIENEAEPVKLVIANTAVSSASSPGIIAGVCASPGLANGVLVHWDELWTENSIEEILQVESAHTALPDQELARLTIALQQVTSSLAGRITEAERRGATTEAMIFDAHIALLDDPQLILQAHAMIEQGHGAAHAWHTAVAAQCAVLSGLQDSRLAARVTDLYDLEKQILQALSGSGDKTLPLMPEDAILVAKEFTPSDMAIIIANYSIKALCMLGGGPTSHAAIIAGSYGIPTLVALGSAVANLPNGSQVVVDASAGHLEIEPTTERIATVQQLQLRAAQAQNQALQRAAEPATTRDNRHIEIVANIANVADAHLAAAHGADGIGLLRTEFLFLGREAAPLQQEQAETYQAVVDAMQGRPVFIRTIDIGGDKPVSYIPFPEESNPALGLRGVRIEAVHPALVDAQLRALLQVTPLSACRILLPMITEVNELVSLRNRILAMAQSLGITEKLSIGAMIEVPSAALLAGVLAEYADFLSIGTNDLTQYTLAMDRGNPSLASRLDGLHPAVLHLIHSTVAGARQHGKLVSVCGALASDLEAVPVLIGLGVNELSVDAGQIPKIKQLVRQLDFAQCADEVQTLLGMASAAAVRAHCRRVWPV